MLRVEIDDAWLEQMNIKAKSCGVGNGQMLNVDDNAPTNCIDMPFMLSFSIATPKPVS